MGQRLDILVYPAQILLEPCEAVELEQLPELQEFLDSLIYTMFHSGGVGLAAPQVGKNLRIFVIDQAPINGNEADDPWVFVNPKVIPLGDETEFRREGCLSFPGVFVDIERHKWVKIQAWDRHGQPFEIDTTGSGLFSQAVQHENDHLNGHLMNALASKKDARKIEKIFRQSGPIAIYEE